MIHSSIHLLVYLLMPVIHSATIRGMNGAMSQALGGVEKILETGALAQELRGGVFISELPSNKVPRRSQ